MSASMNVSSLEQQQYQDVVDWVENVGPKKIEDLRIAFAAAQSLQSSPHLGSVIRKIDEMGPKLRSDVIGKIATKILNVSESTQGEALRPEERDRSDGLSSSHKRTHEASTSETAEEDVHEPPLKTPKPPLIQERPKEISFTDLRGLPLQTIVSLLDTKSEAQLAQVSRDCKDAVYQVRAETIEKFRSHKDLQTLLPFFVRHPPLAGMTIDKQRMTWTALLREGSELFEVVKTSVILLMKSKNLTVEDKAPFFKKSVHEIVSNPELLHLLLQTDYDRNLIIFFARQLGTQMVELSSSLTLSEKAQTIREYFQENKYIIENLWARYCELTCVPEEICLLPRLQELHISNNCIRSLPDSIVFLPRLRMLSLDPELAKSSRDTIETFRMMGVQIIQPQPPKSASERASDNTCIIQ